MIAKAVTLLPVLLVELSMTVIFGLCKYIAPLPTATLAHTVNDSAAPVLAAKFDCSAPDNVYEYPVVGQADSAWLFL